MASLIALPIDDYLTIRFPLPLFDHRFIAGLMLLDYGRSFAIPVTIDIAAIRAYRHSRTYWSNAYADANFVRACGHRGAYACRCGYCKC